uniref:Ymf56 n=1 Tax=Paramecium caudatum TaxID=5885 RepID=D8L7R9_PARCA|nr:Ymf56 [Paramecium caudatum]CAZ66806.1 Ymf56 [Paramecium caudatum]
MLSSLLCLINYINFCFFENFMYFWFVFVFFSFFNFLLSSLINEFLFLIHFFNKNQIKTSNYFVYLDFWSIFSKKFIFNFFF